LMVSLVSLYFSNVNFFIPLLHRPTFEACLNRRLHIQHPGFASTLLLVCALGSLYLKDPAVPPHERVRLGSRWYDQVQLCGHALRLRPTLYDLQAYSLASHWLICTSNPRFAWSIVGFGLRLAEDMAAHREKVNGPTTTRGDELEKRAFWILSLIDAQLNATLGRSAIIDPLDIDTSLPAECDDEYWQLSGPGAQPPDRPSTIVFFNCLMNLYRILHFALRALYCTRRSHDRLGLSHPWPVAVRLDGAVLNWFNSLPPHLVWDPVRPHALFFDQSAALHCFYYYTRILIYRPFIPAVGPTTQNVRA
ncbi:fungal-specific transcription factor domain-containing protein, partial [Mycena epipterygia]